MISRSNFTLRPQSVTDSLLTSAERMFTQVGNNYDMKYDQY